MEGARGRGVQGWRVLGEGCAGVEGARGGRGTRGGRGVLGWRVLGEGGVCWGGGC